VRQASPDTYPDLHFLYIARNIPADWFFDAARAYWDRFRPTVISNFDLLSILPSDRTIIVTALVMRDSAAVAGVDLARSRPDVYFDAIVRDSFEEASITFAQRVGLNQPFGVPLLDSTPPPTDAAIPTPMLPIQPRNYVTVTPPAAAPAAPVTPEAPTVVPTPAPIQPTPGSIIGGSS